MVLSKNLVELNYDETMNIEGGIAPAAVVGLVILGLFIVGTIRGCAQADGN